MLLFLFISLLIRFIVIGAGENPMNETEHERLDCGIKLSEYSSRFEVKIYLCTRKNENCTLVPNPLVDYKTLELNGFNPSQKTTVLIHGFLENLKRKWLHQMKKLLLQRGPMNVLLVDWSSLWTPTSSKEYLKALLHSFNYRGAVISTSHVAREISRFFKNASKISKVAISKWSKLHFIGHSLGAHIAGQVARKLKKIVHVHRITGLDPANPCFESGRSQLRLNRFDAKIVDVIHTNSDPKDNANFGIHYPLGTIDFYPNSGNNQPGCSAVRNATKSTQVRAKNSNEKLFSISAKVLNRFQKKLFGASTDFEGIIHKTLTEGSSISCNHRKSLDYFIKSLTKDEEPMLASPINLSQLPADENIRCQNRNCSRETCIIMGIDAELSENASGTYYIDMTKDRLKCD